MRVSDKALPWAMSLGIHGVVLLIPLSLIVSPAARPSPSTGVEISLVTAAGKAGSTLGTRDPGAAGRPASVAAGRPPGVAPLGPAANANGSMPLPSAQEVLSDLAALSPSPQEPGTTIGAPLSTLSQGTQIGWAGAQRKLLRKRNPDFPSLLSAMGQEIEGEARITVAPSGAVVRVEITRGSGYIEIDASVEAALRDYLFSRVDGRENAIGTVRFRFRLEKLD